MKIIIGILICGVLFFCGGWFLKFFILALVGIFIFRSFFRFEKQDDQIWVVFGLPGAGKTTLLAEMARQCLKKGINVKTNVPIKGCDKIDRSDMGVYKIEDCVILYDEASIDYFKRDFASFGKRENMFHSMHRHAHAMEVFFAQTWNGMDLRLRELNTKLFYVSKLPFHFIHVRQIGKMFEINDQDKQPIDGYAFVPLWHKFVYAPRVWKMFDSYSMPDLPEKNWEQW